MHIAVLALMAALILLLSLLLAGRSRRENRRKPPRRRAGTPEELSSGKKKETAPRFCLLCGEKLAPGGSMRTSLYPPDGREGRLLEIHGCSRCYRPEASGPLPNAGPSRTCPLCRSTLKTGEPLIARRFEEPGKNRVTVLGCPRCYRPGRTGFP